MGRKGHVLQNLTLISYIGISMVVPIIGGLYMGRWLDKKLNTQPLFLFVLIIMGVVVAFINLFKVTMEQTTRK